MALFGVIQIDRIDNGARRRRANLPYGPSDSVPGREWRYGDTLALACFPLESRF